MLTDKRVFALIWRITGLGFGLSGILLMLYGGIDNWDWSKFYYFTYQTNVFVILLFFVLTILTSIQISKDGTRGEIAHIRPSLQLAVTFYITVTMCVYWMAYRGGMWDHISTSDLETLILHAITPVFAILDTFMFMPHGKVQRNYALWWTAYPIFYSILLLVRAEVAAPIFRIRMNGVTWYMDYPYYSIERFANGGTAVFVLLIIITMALFVLFGMFYINADRQIAYMWRKKTKPEYYYIVKN